MTSRAPLSPGGLLSLYVLVVLRAFQVQVLGVREIRDRGAKQPPSTIPLIPKRGVILDRTGTELAVSVATKSVFVQPAKLRDPDKAADLLAPRVSRSAAGLRRRFARGRGEGGEAGPLPARSGTPGEAVGGRRHRDRRGAETVLPEPGAGRLPRRLHQPGQRGDGGGRALPQQVHLGRGGVPL